MITLTTEEESRCNIISWSQFTVGFVWSNKICNFVIFLFSMDIIGRRRSFWKIEVVDWPETTTFAFYLIFSFSLCLFNNNNFSLLHLRAAIWWSLSRSRIHVCVNLFSKKFFLDSFSGFFSFEWSPYSFVFLLCSPLSHCQQLNQSRHNKNNMLEKCCWSIYLYAVSSFRLLHLPGDSLLAYLPVCLEKVCKDHSAMVFVGFESHY